MGRDRFADLNAPDVAFRHIARRLTRVQFITIGEMHRVIAGVDIADNEILVDLQPLGQIEQVAPLFQFAGDTFDPALHLDLDIHPGDRRGA